LGIKLLAPLLVLLLLAACESPTIAEPLNEHVEVLVDEERDVTCWYIRQRGYAGGAIHCITGRELRGE
jgi:hypothetical protein